MNAFELMAKITLDSSEFDSKLSGIGGKLSSGLGTAAKVGGAAIAAATGAIVAFGGSSVKTGMQFDSAMSQVAATMGTTIDNIQNLRDYALEMGTSTMFSASQAAEAMNYMALAGYDAETTMKMLPNVLNLAAAGGIELASASDMVTNAQSALGLTLEETTDLVDKMAKASSKSNTSVAQLGDAILTVGGTAKVLSGGTTELATTLGILADNGIQASEGGTALRNIILSLSAPTDKAAGIMKQLGLEVFDANGNMRPLNETFGDLNNALSTMTQEQRTQVLSDLFNKVDLKSVNALLGTNAERWEDLANEIDNASGAAGKMGEIQMDNLAGDITYFKSALEGAQIVISDVLTPSLREFVQFGTDGLQRLTDAFKEGGLEGAMDVFGDIVSDGVQLLMDNLPQVVNAGAQLLVAIAKGIGENLPLIAQTAVDIVVMLGQGIANNIPNMIAQLPSIIVGIADFISSNLPAIVDVGIQIIVGIIQGLAQALPELISYAPQIITALSEGIAGSASIIAQNGPEILKALGQGLISAVGELVSSAPQIISSLASFLLSSGPMLFQSGALLMNFVKSGIISGIGLLLAAGKEAVLKVVNGIKSASSQALAAGKQIVQNVANGIKSGISSIISAAQNIVQKIKSAFTSGGWASVGSNIVRGIASGITAGVGAIVSAARAAAQKALNAAKSFLGISSPSKLFRDEVGYFMGLGVAAGLEDAEDETTKAAVKLARDTYSKAKEWIRRTAKMDRWSLQDELNAWIDVQAGFNEGSQQWLDAEETIFDIREKMHDEFMDDEEDRINRDIKRNKRSIAEQIAMWTEFRNRYEKNSEEWLKIDDRIFDLREDLVEKHEKQLEDFGKSAEKLWNNIADAQDKYNDKLESTRDSIAGAYKLFDDVQDREVVSAEEITTNLTRQVNVLRGFYNGLEQLSARGVSAEMVEEIRDMGPKAVDQLDALLSMSDEQLSKYAELYGEKQRIANDEALKEMEDFKAETESTIMDNVNSLIDLYNENGPDIGEALTTGITDGIKRGMSDVIDAAIDLAESTVGEIKNRFGTGGVMEFVKSFTTSKVPFASSGLGISSAGIINNAIANADSKQEYTLNLTMADGSVMAKWIFNPLKDYAASKGQPIVNAT